MANTVARRRKPHRVEGKALTKWSHKKCIYLVSCMIFLRIPILLSFLFFLSLSRFFSSRLSTYFTDDIHMFCSELIPSFLVLHTLFPFTLVLIVLNSFNDSFLTPQTVSHVAHWHHVYLRVPSLPLSPLLCRFAWLTNDFRTFTHGAVQLVYHV